MEEQAADGTANAVGGWAGGCNAAALALFSVEQRCISFADTFIGCRDDGFRGGGDSDRSEDESRFFLAAAAVDVADGAGESLLFRGMSCGCFRTGDSGEGDCGVAATNEAVGLADRFGGDALCEAAALGSEGGFCADVTAC